MRQFVSDLNKKEKLFIGDYDSYSIIKYGISLDNLLYLSKLGLLLYDKLLLPAAFFWQTEDMAQLLFRIEAAIEQGSVLPVIRNSESTIDIQDYFEHRIEESAQMAYMSVFNQPELASEKAGKHNEKYVKALKQINSFAHLDVGSIREQFANNWRNDLTNSFDVNSLRLLIAQSNIPAENILQIHQILLRESESRLFSRAYGIEAIKKVIPCGKCQDKMVERVSWLYLKSNADAYGGAFYYSKQPDNNMIYEGNLILLSHTLTVFGLTKELINSMTIEQILKIRSTPEYINFIKSYRDLLKNVYMKQEDIVSIIKKKINTQMSKEVFWNKIFKPLETIQKLSANAFISLLVNFCSGSPVTKPVIATGTATVVSSVLMKIDTINKYMNSNAFVDFKNYIFAKKYEETIITRMVKK